MTRRHKAKAEAQAAGDEAVAIVDALSAVLEGMSIGPGVSALLCTLRVVGTQATTEVREQVVTHLRALADELEALDAVKH